MNALENLHRFSHLAVLARSIAGAPEPIEVTVNALFVSVRLADYEDLAKWVRGAGNSIPNQIIKAAPGGALEADVNLGGMQLHLFVLPVDDMVQLAAAVA